MGLERRLLGIALGKAELLPVRQVRVEFLDALDALLLRANLRASLLSLRVSAFDVVAEAVKRLKNYGIGDGAGDENRHHRYQNHRQLAFACRHGLPVFAS